MALPMVTCPLCCRPGFNTSYSLCSALVNAATRQLCCPICNENVVGLSKLALHLSKHSAFREEEDSDKKRLEPNPFVYFDSDSGQLFAITPSVEPDASGSLVKSRPSEFESCQELLAKGDFTTDDQPVNEVCDVCNHEFANPTILAVHKQLLHKNESKSIEMEKDPKNSSVACSLCPKTFTMKSSLMVHMKMSHSVTSEDTQVNSGKQDCTVCGKSFNKESALTQHMKTHGEKQWQCPDCLKTFTTKYFLRKHKRIHTGETPYECTQCQKVFTFQQSYHKHMLSHSNIKPYCCSHCGRLFKELSTLYNHERIHSGEKPYACETCGKAFRQRVSYLVHRRIHTGVMPYKCTACNKSFRYKISQRTHKCTEQPPGEVVRTQGLVDRLQAVLNKEEPLAEDHLEEPKTPNNIQTPNEPACNEIDLNDIFGSFHRNDDLSPMESSSPSEVLGRLKISNSSPDYTPSALIRSDINFDSITDEAVQDMLYGSS